MGEFFGSNKGRVVMTVVFAAVIWGLCYLLWTCDSMLSAIVILPCAIAGWRVLNGITPAMFIWMPIFGWIVYFFIKFILSALIGVFVVPFRLGRLLAEKIQESCNE